MFLSRMLRKASACLVFVGAVLASAAGANATPMQITLTATDESTNTFYTETFSDVACGPSPCVPGDTVSGSVNLISVPNVTVGGIVASGELSTSTIAGTSNILQSSALTVTNTSGDVYSLTAALSGMNFVGPDNQVSLTAAGTWLGTTGSTMTLALYNDPTNTLGAACSSPVGTNPFQGPTPACLPLTTPGDQVFLFNSSTPGCTDAPALNPTSGYSCSPGTFSLADPNTGLFSMTQVWNYTLQPGGELESRGQTEVESEFVSEPASLILLGAAVLGLGLVRRRNTRSII